MRKCLLLSQVRLEDRAGGTYTVPDHWTSQRKLQLLDIHLQNWDQPRLVPAFTGLGFRKERLAESLHGLLVSSLQTERALAEPCLPSGHINCLEAVVDVIPLSREREVKEALGQGLRELAEDWAGLELELSTVYGPRRYSRHSRLSLHVDRLSTHVISAIVNIQQEVDRPWLLDILDNSGRAHQVELRPGEMLLYESARLPHGRTRPLEGQNFTNIFVHFRPREMEWFTEDGQWKL